MTPTDTAVIKQIRAGDKQRYAVLVDRYKHQALTLAVRLLGDRQEAEEAVQDAFVRAFRNLEQFRGDARFSTWLYRIVYNVCLTRISRRGAGAASLNDEAVHSEAEQLHSDVMLPDEALSSSEMHQVVRSALMSLPEKYRAAITLFYLEENSYEEIGSVLDVPVGTVKTLLFRGRAMLRERLVKRLEGDLV